MDQLVEKVIGMSLNEKTEFHKKIISDLKVLLTKNLLVSDEGETGNGSHENNVVDELETLGWNVIEDKKVMKVKVNGKIREEFLMDKTKHAPNKILKTIIPLENGFYVLPQPYSKKRGSFNPAPDMYLIKIEDKSIVEYCGLECKSSKLAKPTWNDNLPRKFEDGNILYLFTGNINGKISNTLFNGEIFFNDNYKTKENIDKLFTKLDEFIEKQISELGLTDISSSIDISYRRKCEQRNNFTEDKCKTFNKKIFEFLDKLSSFKTT